MFKTTIMITKPQVKKILLDLIYTADGKPRFIGGDVSGKLEHIDDAVDKIIELTEPNSFDKAHDYLIQSDEDVDLPVEAQVLAIVNQSKNGATTLIDWVEGVQVVEKFENTFTCQDFLNHISWK
jgi:hypothetical protein